MLKNVGKLILPRRARGAARKKVSEDGFEILGQTGVPPVTYPDLAGMALGWAGQN